MSEADAPRFVLFVAFGALFVLAILHRLGGRRHREPAGGDLERIGSLEDQSVFLQRDAARGLLVTLVLEAGDEVHSLALQPDEAIRLAGLLEVAAGAGT